MKYLAHTLAVSGLIASIGTVGFAQEDVDTETLTCSDFVAMSETDQDAAWDAVQAAQMAETTDDSAAMPSSDSTGDASGSSSDMSASDTASDSATTDSAGADASASSDSASGSSSMSGSSDTAATDSSGTDSSSSSDMAEDPERQALLDSCDGQDDALVMDQLEAS